MKHVLLIDMAGTPREWITPEIAVKYHAQQMVKWQLGDTILQFRGGYQRDGHQSLIESKSIIAVSGKYFDVAKYGHVAVSNRRIFSRDRYRCAFCGVKFTNLNLLSRDHIVPQSKGGPNTWNNVVTSCYKCNSKKADRTPEQAGMKLLYEPYVPNHWETLLLENKSPTKCQYDYLINGIPSKSRILQNEE